MRENRLGWFWHVIRREKMKAVRVVIKTNIVAKTGIGRSKKICLDTVENNMRSTGVCVGNVENRDDRRSRTKADA